MIRRYAAGLRALLMGADFLATVVIGLGLATALSGGAANRIWAAPRGDALAALVVYAGVWVAVLWASGLYRLRVRWSFRSEAAVVIRAVGVVALGTVGTLFVLDPPDLDRAFFASLLLGQAGEAIAARTLIRSLLSALRRKGRNTRNVLVLGTGPEAVRFAQKLEDHSELGLRIAGFLGPALPENVPSQKVLGPLERLADVLHDRVVDEVVVALPLSDWTLLEPILELCESEGKMVRVPLSLPALKLARGQVEDLDGTPVLSLTTGPTTAYPLALKRVLDATLSAVGLIVLLPLIAGIAIAVRVGDGGPILFGQERVGLHGRRFRLYKFRTMVGDAELRLAGLAHHNEIRGAAFKLTADPRVTSIGRFLRRSSLDELPQLLNVLRGEMSLVGPRPPLPSEVAMYDVWHRRRLSMKPGITGLWQVEGRREPEFDRWVQKDLEYIDRWSTRLDVEILLRTIPAVLRAEGR